MPLYDYYCETCNKVFELLVKIDQSPVCPDCGTAQLEKLVSKPSAPGESRNIIAKGRAQAAREGHFSNYKPSERPRTR